MAIREDQFGEVAFNLKSKEVGISRDWTESAKQKDQGKFWKQETA